MAMYARNVSQGRDGKEVKLRLQGMHARHWEKNWSPFVHGGRLFMSYGLSPEHVVLSCELETGICDRTHATPSLGVWSRLNDQILEAPRLSTPPLLVRGRYISIGHYRTGNTVYEQFWYEMQTEPPFAILRSSRPFRFFSGGRTLQRLPPLPSMNLSFHSRNRLAHAARGGGAGGGTASGDGLAMTMGYQSVQYVSGLYLSPDGKQLILSYGVGDQGAMRTAVKLDHALAMLEDAGDATQQYHSCLANGQPSYGSRSSCESWRRTCMIASRQRTRPRPPRVTWINPSRR